MVAKITHYGTTETSYDEFGHPTFADFKRTITLDEKEPISKIKEFVYQEINSAYRGGRVVIDFYNS